MAFPQGGDFARSVNSLFKILKADRRICVYDNETTVCGAGHKLKYPGNCFSQPKGVFNSTDDTFQPTYTVCTSDYVSRGFSPGVVFSSGNKSGNWVSAAPPGGVSCVFSMAELSLTIDRTLKEYMAAASRSGSTFLQRVVSGISSWYILRTAPISVSSFWYMAQFNPGALPHLPDVYSDLYVYDVFSSFAHYNRLVINMLEVVAATLKQAGVVDSLKNVVQTDYYTTISGEEDICVGDSVPPQITLYSPSVSGSHLRPTDQIVDFSLSDPIGGVDLSTVYVSLESTASGTFSLLEAGADQTGGDIAVTGDSRSYRFTYTPPFLWDYNDQVVVSVSGSDLVPQVDGNPFYCGAAGVNEFTGDIPFQVLNYDDFSASIGVQGDVEPPTLSAVPASGTADNSVFTPIYIGIADNLTGVDLSSLYVNVAGTTIIQDGAAVATGASVGIVSGGYAVYYNKPTAFTYGSTASITVHVADLVEAAPNNLATTYELSFIADSTLVIENFSPPAGTSANPSLLDISVDIRDDSFGVDESQCFFVINGTVVSGTQTLSASGVNLAYHPSNGFVSETSFRVLVHAVNGNTTAPAVKEELHTIYPGYRIVHYNDGLYTHGESVDVFVKARNTELLHKDLSTGYFFTAYTQPQSDLGAEIFAINPIADLAASLTPIFPEHRYGETVTVRFFVKDLEGHELGPYTFTYTIEDRPD